MQLGEIYVKLDRLDEAEKILRRCLEMLKGLPKGSEAVQSATLEVYRTLGDAYLKQGKYVEAGDAVKKALEMAGTKDPRGFSVLNITVQLATVYFDQGRTQEATEIVDELVDSLEQRVTPGAGAQQYIQLVDALSKAAYMCFDRCLWDLTERSTRKNMQHLVRLLQAHSSVNIRQVLLLQETNLSAVLREQILVLKTSKPDSPQIAEKENEITALEQKIVEATLEMRMGAPLATSKCLRSDVATFKPSNRSYVLALDLKRIYPVPVGDPDRALHLPVGSVIEFQFENARDGAPVTIVTKTVDFAVFSARRIEITQAMNATVPVTRLLRVVVSCYADATRERMLGAPLYQFVRLGEEPNQYKIRPTD